MEYVDLVWNGDRKDFHSTVGIFHKGVPIRVSLENVKMLTKLSQDFIVGDTLYSDIRIEINSKEKTAVSETVEVIKPINKITQDVSGKLTIGISRQEGLGDIILICYFVCLPLKKQNRDCEITFFCPSQYHELLKTFNFIDFVGSGFTFDKMRSFTKFYDFNKMPEFNTFDKNLSRPELFSSVLDNPSYIFDTYSPPIKNVDTVKKIIEKHNKNKLPIVGVSLVSKSVIRTYPPENLTELIKQLSKNYFVLILGQDNHGWGLKQWNGINVFSTVGKNFDLVDIAAFISQCDYGISNDSGLLYLFGIMKIPTIVIFGNIKPEARIKFFPTIFPIISPANLQCIPCGDKFNPCPYTKNQFGGGCLEAIKPENIVDTFEQKVINSDAKKLEVANKIQWLYSIVKQQKLTEYYPYNPSKVPIPVKDKYKILIVVPHIFMGGGETQLLYLLQNLKYYGFECKLVVENTVDSDLYPVFLDMLPITILSDEYKPEQLREIINNSQPDILLFHGTSIVGKSLNGVEKKPIIIQIMHTGSGVWTEDSFKITYNYLDCAVPVAKWIEDKFKKQFPNMNFSTVLNGIPYFDNSNENFREEFNIAENDFVIGLLSRFGGEKQINLLIDSMKKLPVNFKLFLGGWGGKEQELRNQAKISKLESRVIFAGVIQDRKKFFNTIDCAALTSGTEGNSMFLLEAAMAKKPIVTTNVGAASEIFEHEYSAMILPDYESIPKYIKTIAQNRNFARSLGENAYNKVSSIASDTVMSKGYVDIFREELKRRQDPKSILLFRNGGIGDILMSTPAVRYLRSKFPKAFIIYLTGDSFTDILAGNENIDSTLSLSRYSYNEIARNFDVAIEFQHYEVWNTHEHIINHYLKLVGAEEQKDFILDVNLSDIRNFNIKEPYVCIHRKTNMACKNWGTDAQWLEIINYLSKEYKVIELDGYYERKKLSIRESIKLISKAKFLIGLDSFPIHGAKSVDCPAIAIYGGASDPSFCGYEDNMNVVSSSVCKCYGSKSLSEVCTKNYECLDKITVKDIISAIEEMEKRL